jgi:hypothetical protein
MAENDKSKWLWRIVGWVIQHWGWLAPFVGGIAVAAATPFNKYLQVFAPVSYVVAFILGAMLAGIAALIVTVVLHIYAKSKYWNHVTAKVPEGIDPMQQLFTEERVDPRAISNPVNLIVRGKDFHRCEIIGARLTYLFYNCKFVTQPQFVSCNYISNPGPFPSGQNNIFVFENCNFTDCKFYFMTVLFSEPQARALMKGGGFTDGWIVPPLPEAKAPSK